MSISSINSNLAALLAQSNIGNATTATSNDVSALSSGNRIVSASTDVAALAAGTGLQSQVNVLNSALSVASQGSSLLQVADGGLAQIQSILQRQQAIATSAQSGSLSSTQRGFLDQEFQQLSQEIDQLSSSTSFNGVNLLDGSIAGNTSISTNTATGSTTLPPSATIATVVTNVGLSGSTLTLAVGGQPSINLTFGAGAGQIKIGSGNANVADTAANVAAALNDSGIAQLSNFRFSSDASGDVKAYYTGTASATSGIPSIKTTASAANTIVNNTGTASFSAAQSIADITGTVAAGDTLTVGTHTFTFDANGTNVATGYNAGTNTVDIGATGTETTGALTNLAALLNSVAGNTGYTDLANINFTVDTTTPTDPKLIATYSGNSSTPPTISTSYVSHSTGTLASSGNAQSVAKATSVFTAAQANDFTVGSSLVIDGQTITFTANGAHPSGFASTGTTTGNVDIGTGGGALTTTLANIAAFLNNTVNNAHLTNGSGADFSSDGTNIYASSSTNTAFNVSATLTSVVPTGDTATNVAGAAGSSGTVGLDLTAGGNLNVGNILTVNGHALTLVNTVTDATHQIAIGSNTANTLNAISTYLNNATNQTALGINADVTTTVAGTTLTFANTDTSAHATTLTLTAGTPADAPATSNVSVTPGSNVGTFGGNINAGDSIEVAGKFFTFAAAGTVGNGTGTGADITHGIQIDLAATPTTADTLSKLVSYLNTSSITPGTAFTPLIPNTQFASNGSTLYATNTAGSSTTNVTITFTPATAPTFHGVTGANLAEISSTGLGAGTTSAVGTPSGSLFVTSSGASSVTNHGQGIDLSQISNNAAFVGAFGGTGTIGAISATYVNTGNSTNNGVQFSVTVGDDIYTTNTITNTALTSTTAPVSIVFNGSNSVTSAAEGGTFTLTLQPQTAVTSQNGANQLATGINAALSTVTANQNRGVLSYNNNYSATVGGVQVASLAGSSLTLNSGDFTDTNVSSVTVTAPTTGSTDAKISAVVNGETYSTISGIGDVFGANSQITLVNQTNPGNTLTLTLGTDGSADLSSASNAAAFQTALSNSLGLSNANAGLSFQVGATSAQSIGITLGSASSSALFNGATLDVKTSADAVTAANAVTNALNTVTSLRATVGASEERFNFATTAIQNAVQNQGAAKSNLLDTDVAATSTDFATAQVQLQAGIAVLAQANQLQQNLLKLL